MKYSKQLIWIFVASVVFVIGCRSTIDPAFDPNNGAHFSTYINGGIWIAGDHFGGQFHPSRDVGISVESIDNTGYTLQLMAERGDAGDRLSNIILFLKNVKSTGTYQLLAADSGFTYGYYADVSRNGYSTGAGSSGSITFSLFDTAFIDSIVTEARLHGTLAGNINLFPTNSPNIKGTFNFTAKSTDGSTVTVSNGQFDMTLGHY